MGLRNAIGIDPDSKGFVCAVDSRTLIAEFPELVYSRAKYTHIFFLPQLIALQANDLQDYSTGVLVLATSA